MTRLRLTLLIGTTAMLLGAGCAARRTGVSTGGEQTRNPLEAQRLTSEAFEAIGKNPERAETLLRQALDADLFHGPAHNNLGVLLLDRGELYEAAVEFEWARKLMPGHPDPRLNLAMTLERAGRINDALEEYRSALEAYPGHIQSVQAMTRCRLRHRPGDLGTDPQLEADLREIGFRGESAEWREWARGQLLFAD
jgi:tetratricopeptide (TPR) repeat protein